VSHQEALTVVAEVDAQRLPQLPPVLAEMRADPGHNAVLPFGRIAGCHFGRVLLLPPSSDLSGRPVPPQLLMLTDCDGSAARHVEAMVDAAGAGLDRLFGACKDYPAAPVARADRIAFLRRKTVDAKANYVHRQGRTVEQIRGEAELRGALSSFLAAEDVSGVPAVEVRKRIRAFLRKHGSLSWALSPPPRVGLRFRARNALHATTLPLGLVAFGPVVVPAALLLLGLVRLQEMRDRSEHVRPTPEHVRALSELEDFFAHNGFTAGGYVKPGWVRQAVIAAVLPLIGWGTRHLFTRDSLAGVKTIHFARWIPLDGGRRVVFASNYDGSLESYNNDFIDLVAWGLNLVFSNGLGYPETRWLLFGGASREQEFKDYLRRHQIPTPVWYSAYPHLSAVNVERNAKLRAGLRGRMNEDEARQWLRLL
jgi:hypothetical protein